MRRRVDVDLNGSGSGLRGMFTGAGRDAEGLSAKLAGIGKRIAKSMAVIGVAGAAAVGVGLNHAVDAALESQKIARETERVVESTGGAANVSAKHIADYSGKLSELIGVDDELIQQNANVLTTFTKVRNEVGAGNDIWNQGVAIAFDMAEVMKSDVQGAMVQVGKALNDPIKGMTALTRAGVSFTQQQKDQVRAMVEAGDTLGAQKLILDEMRVQFGGAAEAAATPMDRLKVALGNVEEEIGAAFVPAVEGAATWLGNKLPSAIEWGRSALADLAPTVDHIRDGFLGIAERAAPYLLSAWEDIVAAGRNLWTILQAVAREVGPLVRTLGEIGGSAILSGIQEVANSVRATTGYFAENEDAVRLVIAAVLTLAGIAAWARIWSALETMYILWLYFAQAVGATTIMQSLGLIVTGFGNMTVAVATLGRVSVGGFAQVKAGLLGVAGTLGPILLVVGAVYGLMTLFRGGKADADRFAESLVDIDSEWDVEGMKASLESVTTTLDQESAKWEGSGFWSRLGRAATEILPGVDDGIIATRRNIEALSATNEELAASLSRLDERSATLASTLGMSQDQVMAWMETLKLDPDTMGYDEMESKIVDAATAASASTPQTEALAESYTTLGNEAAGATDQLSAYKDMVDAILGVQMSSFEAQTNYGAAIAGLNEALTANGSTLDANTEKGRANRDALQGAADAALGWAETLAAEGDFKGASDTLTMLRENIVGVAEDLLGSRPAAEAFVDSIGLTQENLATLASGVTDPLGQLGLLQGQLDVLGGTVAAPGVEVDTLDAYSTMEGFAADFDAWIGEERPAVEARLETQTAAGRLESLDILMREYANSNPMAKAWLDSQPAEVQQAALERWVEHWKRTHPKATASIYVDESSAAAAQRRLDNITQTRTMYVNIVPVGTDIGVTYGGGARNRWGGLYEYAKGGITPAKIERGTQFMWAEPETGGEAFIPRLGDTERSVAILRKIAEEWFGLAVVDPKALTAFRSGGIQEDQPGYNWRTMGNGTAGATIARAFPNGLLGDTDQNGRLDPGEWERWRAAETGALQTVAAATTEMATATSRMEVASSGRTSAASDTRTASSDDGAATLTIERLQLVTPDGKVLAEEVDMQVLAKRTRDDRRGRNK